jgi:hypothetical protein
MTENWQEIGTDKRAIQLKQNDTSHSNMYLNNFRLFREDLRITDLIELPRAEYVNK